ncbi:MAG TPA: T9SS type A sorting domain-containing protein [Candidatus Eisenbacteria bacterium]|jgi:hypothetical protein
MRPPLRLVRIARALALAIAALPLAAPAAEPRAVADPERHDPLLPLVLRMDRYLQQNESGGVVLDPRWVLNETEAVRLSVTPQLLGYAELYRLRATERFRQDIVDRADYLLARFDQVRSGTVFDGMLGYAFFEAWDATGDARYFDAARAIVVELEAQPGSELILNGGLMAAMAFAAAYRLTGDAEAERLARVVLTGLPGYQNADGSFPHWCPGSEDVSYTDWMAMELILIQRRLDDPLITPMLESMTAFMERRVDATGNTSYEEPCPEKQGCTIYYWSVASGCSIDYDTRAFTNELGYSLLLLDHFRSPRYDDVMRFTLALERGGTFADKWDFWPPPSDPYYPWTAADTSVVNISVNFWALAAALPGRPETRPGSAAWGLDGGDPAGGRRPIALAAGGAPRAAARPTAPVLASAAPNPSRSGFEIRFPGGSAGAAEVAIFDAMGRRVRTLSAASGAGGLVARWDGRDDAGLECRGGLYFARLGAGAETRSVRLLRLR